jgi:uncharacterized membrane protein
MKHASAPAEHGADLKRSKSITQGHCRTNIGTSERWLSSLAGAALIAYGLERRSGASAAAALAGGALLYRGLSGRCPVYSALGTTTRRPPATSVPAGRGIKVEKSFTILRRPLELYNFWRHFENLPSFMQGLQKVETWGNRSHWKARGPMGIVVEWDAEILMDRPPETISWRSLPGGDIDCAGSVHFKDLGAGRGTELRVILKYDPPAGKLGTSLATLLGKDPGAQIAEDLRRFKQLMESGELATIGGQPSSRHSSRIPS